MYNEIRYRDVTSAIRVRGRTARARTPAKTFLQSARILSWVEIDFAVALIAPRSIEYSPLFRTRIYRTDRQDAREEAAHEKSPLVNHRVTLCVYIPARADSPESLIFFSPSHVCYSHSRDKNKNRTKRTLAGNVNSLFITRRYFSLKTEIYCPSNIHNFITHT